MPRGPLPAILHVTHTDTLASIPPMPSRVPPPGPGKPLPVLRRPPLKKACRLKEEQGVLCFSFGQGRELTAGASNRALAAFVSWTLAGGEARPTILAQWEIARELETFGIQVAYSAEQDGQDYLTTKDVIRKFVEWSVENYMWPQFANNLPVAIVAHPDHAWRCWALAMDAGYNDAFVVDFDSSECCLWEDFDCTVDGYDKFSVQPHTRRREMFLAYEHMMQEEIYTRNPEWYDSAKACIETRIEAEGAAQVIADEIDKAEDEIEEAEPWRGRGCGRRSHLLTLCDGSGAARPPVIATAEPATATSSSSQSTAGLPAGIPPLPPNHAQVRACWQDLLRQFRLWDRLRASAYRHYP